LGQCVGLIRGFKDDRIYDLGNGFMVGPNHMLTAYSVVEKEDMKYEIVFDFHTPKKIEQCTNRCFFERKSILVSSPEDKLNYALIWIDLPFSRCFTVIN
jgi:hypothetical protein